MPNFEVYVLVCYGCGEKLTLRAGEPSEVRFCPTCETLLDIDWRPEDHSHSKRGENRMAVPPVAANGKSTVSANRHLGVK
ncbi:MAG: hypothetical protein ABFD89_21345 [Bryobacteraceae bacterium]